MQQPRSEAGGRKLKLCVFQQTLREHAFKIETVRRCQFPQRFQMCLQTLAVVHQRGFQLLKKTGARLEYRRREARQILQIDLAPAISALQNFKVCRRERADGRLTANFDHLLLRGQMVGGDGQACAISRQRLAIALQTRKRLAVANIRLQAVAIDPERLLCRMQRFFITPQHGQHGAALGIGGERLRAVAQGLIKSAQRQIMLPHQAVSHAYVDMHRRRVRRAGQRQPEGSNGLPIAACLRQEHPFLILDKRILRAQRACLFQRRNGFVREAQRLVGDAQHEPGFGVDSVERANLRVKYFGFRRLPIIEKRSGTLHF